MNVGAARGRGLVLTLASVLLAGAAPLLYVATLDVPFLRRSGVLLFGVLVLALACVARARAMQAPLSRIAVVLVFVTTLAAAWFFFVRQRLPSDSCPAVGSPAPSVVATVHDGSSFDLDQARRSGPILLVFYRGFW
ncbi:MAG: hypothetical protein R3F56_14780 [Planctomycetota bacterium]